MIFHKTRIPGVWLIELERIPDERGFFARSFCAREFEDHGLESRVAQCNVSFNRHRGTLRGMHSALPPHAEAKLVRCTRGAIHDVVLDLRSDSPAYLRHEAVSLTADNRRMLYIPEGVFHGFLTLTDDAEIFYQMTEFYVASAAVGVRWDDPAFGIEWPGEVRVISERDRSYPDYELLERED